MVRPAFALVMDDPLVFEPGPAYAYSSYAYNLISAVVEGASGQSFLEYMERSVFVPLAMPSTGLDLRTAIIPHRTRFYGTPALPAWEDSWARQPQRPSAAAKG